VLGERGFPSRGSTGKSLFLFANDRIFFKFPSFLEGKTLSSNPFSRTGGWFIPSFRGGGGGEGPGFLKKGGKGRGGSNSSNPLLQPRGGGGGKQFFSKNRDSSKGRRGKGGKRNLRHRASFLSRKEGEEKRRRKEKSRWVSPVKGRALKSKILPTSSKGGGEDDPSSP